MAEKLATAPAMKRAAPFFLVDDVFATAEFYRDMLGFSVGKFFGDPPSFTIVQRDEVRILLRQVRHKRASVGRPNRAVMDETFDAYIWVSNVDALAAELRTKKADILEGPVDRIYEMRELLVRDLNGYALAFGQE
jgi:catechol 2,3-dioxygenase-like lactoylglutathione lyase family enzyme